MAYAENSCEQRRLQVAFGFWRATVAQRNLAARQNAADITAHGVFPQGSLDASLLPRSLLPPAQPFVGLPAAKEASELGGLDDRPFQQPQRGSPGLLEPSTMTAAPSPSAWQSESLLKLGGGDRFPKQLVREHWARAIKTLPRRVCGGYR